MLTARGERSRFLGADARYADHVTLDATNLQSDTLFSDIRNRRVVEKLLADPVAGPGRQTRAMVVKGYAAGVNAYLRDVGGSKRITDPACKGARWVRPDATAKDIWYAVYAANLLAPPGCSSRRSPVRRPVGRRSRPARGAGDRPVRAATDRCARTQGAARRARQGPGLSLRLQRHRGRQGGDHHRPRDGARQPALPLARALPVHPVPPDHPRSTTWPAPA